MIKIYDPAMCCSTGICGPSVDPELARIARDLKWLSSNDVPVNRYNLAQDVKDFAENPTIQQLLQTEGPDCLPVTLVNDKVMKKKIYPTTEELVEWTGVQGKPDPMDNQTNNDELIEIEGL